MNQPEHEDLIHAEKLDLSQPGSHEEAPLVHLAVFINRERGTFLTEAHFDESMAPEVLVTALYCGLRRLLNSLPQGVISESREADEPD